jgi:hypothetical protein
MSDDPDRGPDTGATWGPYPGDATQPPPTPVAPEIPMTSRWLWMAGLSVAARLAILAALAVVVVVVIVALLT